MSFILDLNNIKPITLEDLEPKEEVRPNTVIGPEKILEPEKSNEQVADTNIIIEEKIKIPKKKSKVNDASKTQIQVTTKKNNLLLSIKEAETLSGISKISIRKAIKAKEINYSLDDGKYKIDFNDLLTWCYSSTRRKNVFNTAGIGKFVNSWNTIID